ncbi:unnamed protein product [Zymoseptoria tritici ST99CH_3D1]|nr:unnamed protein product [Zymoseptoria tritici ST99CH_3D1]
MDFLRRLRALTQSINDPVDNTVPSSSPRFVIQQPRRFDRDVNKGVEQAASPTPLQLVIPPHHHSSEEGDDEDDEDVRAAPVKSPTLPLPAKPLSHAHPTSLSASYHHCRHLTTPASVSSSSYSLDLLVGAGPYKFVAHTPSSALHGSRYAEEMGQRGRSRDWMDGRDGIEDNDKVQRSSPLSRRAFVVGLRTLETTAEKEEEVGHNGESGSGMGRKEEGVWWKGGEEG